MNPYIFLGGVGVAIVIAFGSYTYGVRHEKAVYEAVLTKERADAVKAAADFAAQSAAKDAKNAELSRDLENARAKAIADADASAADFAERLRAASSAARRRCVPAPAADTDQPAQPAAGSDSGSRAVAAGTNLRQLIKTLQADVKLCVDWAHGVGR